jgi:hypothetical protein
MRIKEKIANYLKREKGGGSLTPAEELSREEKMANDLMLGCNTFLTTIGIYTIGEGAMIGGPASWITTIAGGFCLALGGLGLGIFASDVYEKYKSRSSEYE